MENHEVVNTARAINVVFRTRKVRCSPDWAEERTLASFGPWVRSSALLG